MANTLPAQEAPNYPPNRGDHPQSAGEQFLPQAGINPIIPWTTPTPRTRGNQPYSGRTTKPQAANPPARTQGSTIRIRAIRPAAGTFPRTPRDLPCRPYLPGTVNPFPLTRGDLPEYSATANQGERIPPHTRGSAVYLKETPASLNHSPSHAGIRPSHNPRRNPARHIPPHTREPIHRTRLLAP